MKGCVVEISCTFDVVCICTEKHPKRIILGSGNLFLIKKRLSFLLVLHQNILLPKLHIIITTWKNIPTINAIVQVT